LPDCSKEFVVLQSHSVSGPQPVEQYSENGVLDEDDVGADVHAAVDARGEPAPGRTSIIRCLSGIEGYFPDKNTVVGFSVRVPRLLRAFRFSGGGFQIAPAVGEILDMAFDRVDLLMADRFSRLDDAR